MIYAGILAAGLDARMHRQDIPRPFLFLGQKPIIIHTLEQFYLNANVDAIIVVASETWMQYTQDIIREYDDMGNEAHVIAGGVNKTESIFRVVDYIESKWGIADGDILIAHDAIRPFVTQRIIDENIETARAYGAANTAMIPNDTTMISLDGRTIAEIPPKERMYAQQTPQSYMLATLRDMFSQAAHVRLSDEAELARLYIQFGHPMRMVRGEYSNMKIITPYDLEVANALLRERPHD